MEGLHVVAANVASPRSGRRIDFSCKVGGTVRGVCEGRVDQIAQSKRNLQRAGSHCETTTASARRRRGDDLDSRVIRAENLVHVGELSSARQALEGDSVAPGTQATLDKLQDVQRRPPQPREAMPPEIMGFQPPTLFQLRSARRGGRWGALWDDVRTPPPIARRRQSHAAPLQAGRELGKSSRV